MADTSTWIGVAASAVSGVATIGTLYVREQTKARLAAIKRSTPEQASRLVTDAIAMYNLNVDSLSIEARFKIAKQELQLRDRRHARTFHFWIAMTAIIAATTIVLAILIHPAPEVERRSIDDTSQPWDASDLKTAVLIVDKKLERYVDRAKDLRDAFSIAGEDAFVAGRMDERINKAVRPYNAIREEIHDNQTQYFAAMTRFGAVGQDVAGRLGRVIRSVQAFHEARVLPLNLAEKQMGLLADGSSEAAVESRRAQAQEMAKMVSLLSEDLGQLEGDIRSTEDSIQGRLKEE
jgi:hypothetical protein